MINLTENFQFSPRAKKTFIGMMVVGLLGLILAFVSDGDPTGNGNQHARFWTNLLLNTYYFNGIALCGTFFIAATTTAYAGWATGFRRVASAMGGFVTITFACMFIILIAVWAGQTNLYGHWVHPHPGDDIVAGKSAYLNLPFFSARLVIFFGLWILFNWLIRKASHEEDTNPGLANYEKQKKYSAIYLLIFGVSTSMMSWDFNMSLDPHWYSTLYGWYNFGSYMCAFWAILIVLSVYLKSRGYLKVVNENHIHDLGKLMFAFTVFYTYTWYDQYMLQWYSNIPEDTIWHLKRFSEPMLKFIFFATFVICFVFPLLFLMSRDAKRNFGFITFMSLVIVMGHYLDFYYQIVPEPTRVEVHEEHHEHASLGNSGTQLFASNEEHHGTEDASATHEDGNVHHTTTTAAHDATHEEADTHGHGEHHTKPITTYATLGIPELMIFIGFLGAFMFVVFNGLTKSSLVAINHPYLKESIRHHI